MKDRSLSPYSARRRDGSSPRAPSRALRAAPAGAWIGRPLAASAAALLLGAGLVGWRGLHRPASVPAGSVSALSPDEAPLLAAAARAPSSAAPYRKLAEAEADRGRPVSALWAYAEASARAPGDCQLRLEQAEAMAQTGFLRPAEAALQALMMGSASAAAEGQRARFGEAEAAAARQARRDLAELLLATGRPAEAQAVLHGAGAEVELLRGRIFEALGQVGAAADCYRRAGQAGDADGFERLARLELASGDLAGAQAAMRALAGVRAARPSDLLLVAAIHAAAGTPGELDAALDRLRRCLELQPGNAEAHYQAGLLLLRRGDRAAALEQLEQAVRLDGNHTAARERLAQLLQAMGQTRRAREERVVCDELTDQPDRAVAEFLRAPAFGPDSSLSRTKAQQQAHAIVVAASEAGQRAAVVRQLEAGRAREPGNVERMLALGMLYREGGAAAALKRLCRDWKVRQPASGIPDWLLGGQALNEGRPAEAIACFQAACAKEPERADFRMALGLARLATDTVEGRALARSEMERALALDPQTPGPYRQLGLIFEQAGDLNAARFCYLRFLDRQPDEADVLNSLVRVLQRQEHGGAARVLAVVARAVEDQARERQQLGDAVRAHPADGAARAALARFLIRQGQLIAARNQLQRAAEAGPAAAPARRALVDLDRLLRVQTMDGG